MRQDSRSSSIRGTRQVAMSPTTSSPRVATSSAASERNSAAVGVRDTAVAGIGTAVVLFPIVKRQSEAIALGYVATRVLESTIIVVGVISLLAVVTVRQDLAGAGGPDRATLDVVGRALVAIKDGTFLLGPAYWVLTSMTAWANASGAS
jgi:hypothetical protein